jgi:glyoxylase-like metal-dependent hydrolase (beta-lactamase superfamily II)
MIATKDTTTPSAPPRTGIAGLHASRPERLPFAPALAIRAFALERPRGNLLVYSTSELDAGDEWLRDLGGVERQYLNHGHEAMFAPHALDAPLFVHEADRESVGAKVHVRASFSRRHHLDEDFEVIPTPGHTPGATAYLWDSGEHRLLFTGDTLYLADGEWRAGLLASSDRAALLDSLVLIRDLDFDVLVPWAATAGRPYLAHTDPADKRRRIDAIVDGIWRGSPD